MPIVSETKVILVNRMVHFKGIYSSRDESRKDVNSLFESLDFLHITKILQFQVYLCSEISNAAKQ